MSQTPAPSPPGSRFAATRWSLVLAARRWPIGSEARRAMGTLAGAYWYPLYAYLRRRGIGPAESEDLVQGFFSRILENDGLANVGPEKGRFRSFLLTSLQHYVVNEHAKAHAAKRGGGVKVISLDSLDAEARYALEPADAATPERLYERRWAMAVIERVLGQLRNDYARRGQSELLAALEPVLTAAGEEPYAAIAARLKNTESAVKVAAHRVRRRYRDLLREQIAQTVAEPGQVEDEIRHLMASL